MKIIITNPALALDVQIAVSREETRYYLNGFHVERAEKGIYLVSTDGHRMVVLHDAGGSLDGDSGPVRLPKFFLTEMKSAIKKASSASLVIEGDIRTNIATLSIDGVACLTTSGVVIDGKFPEWKRVLPEVDHNKPFVSAPFNFQYLADFGKLCRRGDSQIAAYGNDASNPYLVKISGRDDAFGVLMPMRSTTTVAYPSWLDDETISLKQTLKGENKGEVAA